MKFSLILLCLLLAGCSSIQSISATPTPTQKPSCFVGTCVKDAYLEILDGDVLIVNLDLVDTNNEVNFGDEPKFNGEMTIALLLKEKDGEETYLAGAKIPSGEYDCYHGNDMPWSEGKLAAACGIGFPMSWLQVKIKEGDPIIVDLLKPKFHREAFWLQSE